MQKLSHDKSYGAKEINELGKDICDILNPLTGGDKKMMQSLSKTANTIAREAISIMSEINPEIQLNA